MDNKSEECPLCRMYTEANRMERAREMVESIKWQQKEIARILASEKELEEPAVQNITPTSKKPTASPWKTMTRYLRRREAAVQSVRVEHLNDTLLLTIIRKQDRFADCSAQDAMEVLLNSWIPLSIFDEQ